MTRKDDPFRSGLAMFGFQHAPTRDEFSNSIEPMPTTDPDDDTVPAVNPKASPISALRSLVVYFATLFAL